MTQDPASEVRRGRSIAREQTGRYESSCAKSRNVEENRRNLAETTQYLLPDRKILASAVFQAYREEDAGAILTELLA